MDILQQNFENDNIRIDPNQPFIVKLNIRFPDILASGLNNVSECECPGMKETHDEFVYNVMTRVCNDLYTMCMPNCIYYFHYEILIFFIPQHGHSQLRTPECPLSQTSDIAPSADSSTSDFCKDIGYDLLRITSILSSFASIRLNYYMSHLDISKYTLQQRSLLRSGILHFYGKGFNLPVDKISTFLFSKTSACILMSIQFLVNRYLHTSESHIITKNDIDKYLLDLSTHNIYWDKISAIYRYGLFVKRKCKIITDYIPITENTLNLANLTIYIQEYDHDKIMRLLTDIVIF